LPSVGVIEFQTTEGYWSLGLTGVKHIINELSRVETKSVIDCIKSSILTDWEKIQSMSVCGNAVLNRVAPHSL